ncbi:MAG: helix-turn-helix domain-containing protein [Isosphaeraceae bacterium]
MNCPTTRCSTPAVVLRAGWGEGVPRGTQSKTSIPFAAIPHDIAADPRLSPTDVRVVAALFYFAKADTSCWPCDNSIADRVHCHPGTVQRSLRYLENLGYIRRQPSRENPTGRLIHLTCCEPDWERPPQAPTPTRRRWGGASAGAWGDQAPALAKGNVVVEGLRTEECALPERSRPDPAPPPVDLPTPVAAVPLQAKVPTRVPPAPVIKPPQPALPVTMPAPVVAPQEPQFRPLRKVGLGPQAACPTPQTPPVRSLPAPLPDPGPVSVHLMPEQQARLASLPAASRDQVLRWLATGDPILVAEARSKLAPLQPQPEAPKTLPELLGRIRQDPSYPALAASGLAAALQDQKSYAGYLRRCEEAWRGELNPDQLLSAYEQAMGPKARNRGAIFMVAVRQKE